MPQIDNDDHTFDDHQSDDHAPFRRPMSSATHSSDAEWSTRAQDRSSSDPGYWDDAGTAAADAYDYGAIVYGDGYDAAYGDPSASERLTPDRHSSTGEYAGGSLIALYDDESGPRNRGAQRSLEEALVLWWTDGRLPSLPVLRDGLLMLEAGRPVEDSHRSLLLRTALAHRRGMVTALKHQRDPDRTALIVREALLDRARPLSTAELVRLVREDPASEEWCAVLKTELTTAALSPDRTRSDLAAAALDRLSLEEASAPPAGAPAFEEFDDLVRPNWLRRVLVILLLLAAAVLAAALIGRLVLPRPAVALITIPAGQYTLLNPDEGTRLVTISEFQITVNEVTNAEYRRCVERGVCPPPAAEGSATRRGYFRDPAFNDYPVINVSQAAAQQYCGWLNGRLPTESEWQVAAAFSPILARTYRFPWGDRFEPGLANSAELALGDTLQVGSYHPAGSSPFDLRDAAGNVAEWTMSAAGDDPPHFVVKGGSYLQPGPELQTHLRLLWDGDDPQPWLGFRCAAAPWSWLPF